MSVCRSLWPLLVLLGTRHCLEPNGCVVVVVVVVAVAVVVVVVVVVVVAVPGNDYLLLPV